MKSWFLESIIFIMIVLGFLSASTFCSTGLTECEKKCRDKVECEQCEGGVL